MSSAYDRFKPTALNDIKERQKEVSQMTNEYDNDNTQLFKRKRVKETGIYEIRMFPAHPGKDSNSIEPKVIFFVPSKRKKKDDNGNFVKDSKGQEIWEDSVRAVFDAKVHGESQYDLVDSYISLAKKQADAIYTDNEPGKKDYLMPITGNSFQGGTFKGLNAIRSFVFYGNLRTKKGDEIISEFYEFEISKAIQKGIYNTAAVENSNDPLGTDACFTDPIDGRPIKIIVDTVAGKLNSSDYYKVSIVNETEKMEVNGRLQNVLKSYPIEEETLVWFEETIPSLSSYRTTFKRSDLELQLKGLELFDAEHKFNILNSDEFKQVWNYLDNKFPVTEEDTQNDNSQSSSQNQSSSSSEDEFDLMEIPELKQYIKNNKLGLAVLPSFSAVQIREMIRSIETGDDGEDDVQNGHNTDDVNQQTSASAASTESKSIEKPSASYADRINKLKNA
jgi:hypothetical protein